MKLLKELLYKVLLLYGAILILSYLLIRAQLINFSPLLVVFSILLFLAELHTIFHFFGMLYSLWPRKYKRYPHINEDRHLKINILICVCGEPAEIVQETILAAKETARLYRQKIQPISAPKVVVINDGFGAKKENWHDIAVLCRELDVYHFIRPTNEGFKAGNINNAIKQLETDDRHNTIYIVLDADFSTKPEFLTEITKPFIDNTIDFVQTPQRYKNEETWVAKAAAAHQIYFFEYICPAKAYDNALFLCGTNFAIRQSALDDVGGMDTRFITEDYSTSLNLHLAGKRGVFIPKALALGIAPSTLKGYYNQQRRWAKGTFDASFTYMGRLLFGSLTMRQRFHYLLSATYYLIGLRDLFLMLAPIPYLFFGISLIRANTLGFLTFVYAPLFLYNFTLYLLLFKEPLRSLVLDIISFPVFVQAFIGSVFKEKLAFIVTIKKYEKENVFHVYKVQLLVLITLSIGIITSLMTGRSGNPLAAYINYFWAFFNVFFLGVGFFLMLNDTVQQKDEIAYSKEHLHTSRYLISPKVVLISVFLVVIAILIYMTPEYEKLFQNNTIPEIQRTKNTMEILQTPSKGVYYGYYIPEMNKHPEKPVMNVIPGEKPSLTMFYQDWGEQAGFDKPFMTAIANQHVIPILTWEPWNIKKVGTTAYSNDEFSPQAIASGKYDDYISTWARDAASYKKPFFLRLAHEMNGNWYPWGAIEGNTPEDYKNMWIHIHTIFITQKATNVLWLWTPNNTDAYGSSDSIMSYYPGDTYVDWVGFSGFNWGVSGFLTRWTTFKDIAQNAYVELLKTHKPIMVAETSSASSGGDKTAWFTETLRNDIPSFPGIKAVIFFHDDSRNADFSLLKGMKTYQVIHDNIATNNYYLKYPIFLEKPIKN